MMPNSLELALLLFLPLIRHLFLSICFDVDGAQCAKSLYVAASGGCLPGAPVYDLPDVPYNALHVIRHTQSKFTAPFELRVHS